MKNILLALLACWLSCAVMADPTETSSVLLKTSEGNITLELNQTSAPETCKNFLQYVDDGFYNNTVFHRVIANFMVQGGGFEQGMLEKPTRPPIKNESANGLKNLRGTIAMARTQDPDSASAQFFINIVDNAYLDGTPVKPGYAVFGKVTQGMDVIDKIASVETGSKSVYRDVPLKDIIVISITRVSQDSATPKAP